MNWVTFSDLMLLLLLMLSKLMLLLDYSFYVVAAVLYDV